VGGFVAGRGKKKNGVVHEGNHDYGGSQFRHRSVRLESYTGESKFVTMGHAV
jgi:hypothetical protein